MQNFLSCTRSSTHQPALIVDKKTDDLYGIRSPLTSEVRRQQVETGSNVGVRRFQDELTAGIPQDSQPFFLI
jgi:hypothetical protein